MKGFWIAALMTVIPLAAALNPMVAGNGLTRSIARQTTPPRIMNRFPHKVPVARNRVRPAAVAPQNVEVPPASRFRKKLSTTPNQMKYYKEIVRRLKLHALDRDPHHHALNYIFRMAFSTFQDSPELAQLLVRRFGPPISFAIKKFEQQFVRGSHKELSELEKDFPASEENSQTGSIRAVWLENNPKVPLESAVENIEPHDKIILYFHGGAFIVGSPETHQAVTGQLAETTGAKVLAVDYRLAPQHPYPAALYDVLDVYLTLIKRGVDPSRIVFAGDSAGGNLAVAATLWLRDNDIPMPAGVAAMSPWLDLGNRLSSTKLNGRYDYLPIDRKFLEGWDPKAFNPYEAYISKIAKEKKTRLPVYASPIWARPNPERPLPPMRFFVGDAERLLDSSLLFQTIFPKSVSVKVYENAAHVDTLIALFHDFSKHQLIQVGDWVNALITDPAVTAAEPTGVTWVRQNKEELKLGDNGLYLIWQSRLLMLRQGLWTLLQDKRFFRLLHHHIDSLPEEDKINVRANMAMLFAEKAKTKAKYDKKKGRKESKV